MNIRGHLEPQFFSFLECLLCVKKKSRCDLCAVQSWGVKHSTPSLLVSVHPHHSESPLSLSPAQPHTETTDRSHHLGSESPIRTLYVVKQHILLLRLASFAPHSYETLPCCCMYNLFQQLSNILFVYPFFCYGHLTGFSFWILWIKPLRKILFVQAFFGEHKFSLLLGKYLSAIFLDHRVDEYFFHILHGKHYEDY